MIWSLQDIHVHILWNALIFPGISAYVWCQNSWQPLGSWLPPKVLTKGLVHSLWGLVESLKGGRNLGCKQALVRALSPSPFTFLSITFQLQRRAHLSPPSCHNGLCSRTENISQNVSSLLTDSHLHFAAGIESRLIHPSMVFFSILAVFLHLLIILQFIWKFYDENKW